MDATPDDLGKPEASDTSPTPLPAGFASPGDGKLASPTDCRPLVALELGFHTRMLRTLQESVWAFLPQHIHDVDSGVASIYRRLLALSDRLNVLQFALFTDLKNRIEERHDEAALFAGRIRSEVCQQVADPQEAMRVYPRRIDERAVVLRAWQRADFEEMRLLSRKAVEGDRRLEAWWEIGFRMADIMLRPTTPEAPATWTEGDVEGLLAAVAKLPSEEKAWVEDMLPSTPPTEPRFPLLVNEAYKDLRGFIPEFERRRVQHVSSTEETETDEEFVHDGGYRRCRWGDRPEYEFNESQRLMVKALHQNWQSGGTGLSDAKLFAATNLRRKDKRVEHVFRNFKNGKWVRHRALVENLLICTASVWRLNLEKPKKPTD